MERHQSTAEYPLPPSGLERGATHFVEIGDSALRAAMVASTVRSMKRVTREQFNFGRQARVQRVVLHHLRSPKLCPATLCRLVGMSRSNLYRLLEPTGGVARYIQRQRLLEACLILSNPSEKKPISKIAEDLCFADASSFARAFRKDFGYSPGEVRAAAVAKLATEHHWKPAVPAGAAERRP